MPHLTVFLIMILIPVVAMSVIVWHAAIRYKRATTDKTRAAAWSNRCETCKAWDGLDRRDVAAVCLLTGDVRLWDEFCGLFDALHICETCKAWNTKSEKTHSVKGKCVVFERVMERDDSCGSEWRAK